VAEEAYSARPVQTPLAIAAAPCSDMTVCDDKTVCDDGNGNCIATATIALEEQEQGEEQGKEERLERAAAVVVGGGRLLLEAAEEVQQFCNQHLNFVSSSQILLSVDEIH
jgi:hypothetical protein